MRSDNGFGSLEKTADLMSASLSVEALIRRFKEELKKKKKKKWIKINARVVLARAPARLSLSDASLQMCSKICPPSVCTLSLFAER